MKQLWTGFIILVVIGFVIGITLYVEGYGIIWTDIGVILLSITICLISLFCLFAVVWLLVILVSLFYGVILCGSMEPFYDSMMEVWSCFRHSS